MNKWMWVVIYKLKGSDARHDPADYCTKKEEALAVLKAFEDLFLVLAKLGQLEGYQMDLISPCGQPGFYRNDVGTI